MRSLQIKLVNPESDGRINFQSLANELYPEKLWPLKRAEETELTHFYQAYLVIDGEDQIVSRAILYDNPSLMHENGKAMPVGCFESKDDSEAVKMLFGRIAHDARLCSADWLVGPMNGSTWQTHRFHMKNPEQLFFGEMIHQDYYPRLFEEVSFQEVATYHTNVDRKLKFDKQALEKQRKKYQESGIVLRSLNKVDLKSDLSKVGQLSLEAFACNFLYTPLELQAFISKYSEIMNHVDPKYIWLAEDSLGELQAFSFAYPDYWNQDPKTFVFKSFARKPGKSYAGIGNFLAGLSKLDAINDGFDQMLHAFIYQANSSDHISQGYDGALYHEYKLYGLRI